MALENGRYAGRSPEPADTLRRSRRWRTVRGRRRRCGGSGIEERGKWPLAIWKRSVSPPLPGLPAIVLSIAFTCRRLLDAEFPARLQVKSVSFCRGPIEASRAGSHQTWLGDFRGVDAAAPLKPRDVRSPVPAERHALNAQVPQKHILPQCGVARPPSAALFLRDLSIQCATLCRYR